MKRKISKKRWLKAQNYEKLFWLKNRKNFNNIDVERNLKNDVKRIKKETKPYLRLNKTSKILQIGPGYKDIINFWDIGKKFAIDPLMNFYFKNFPIKKNKIEFTKERAENLPYNSEYFDMILINNVLDHTQNPEKILSEIYRTLKKGGIMYLEVDTFSKILALIRFFAELLQIGDKAHPHTFTCNQIDNLLKRNNFNIVKIVKKGPADRKKIINKMKHSKNTKLKILGYLNIAIIATIFYRVICIK